MNVHRFNNPGKATVYELDDIQDLGRSRTWRYAWMHASDAFHPHSEAEWQAYLAEHE